MQSLQVPDTLETVLSQQSQQRQARFQELLAQARLAFLDFANKRERKDLDRLTRICLEALSYQSQRVEPYAYLAYAMFCAQAPEMGVRYLKLARELAPDFFLVRLLQHQLPPGHVGH